MNTPKSNTIARLAKELSLKHVDIRLFTNANKQSANRKSDQSAKSVTKKST